MKLLASEILSLKIKMVQNPTSWIPMTKSQTSKKIEKPGDESLTQKNLLAKRLTA